MYCAGSSYEDGIIEHDLFYEEFGYQYFTMSEKPDEGMNTMINTWTLYQSEINVMFSRFASFIEVGGRTGLGYRDTTQDAMTIPHSNPEKCKQRIVELLRGLVSEGYGLHLFDPARYLGRESDVKYYTEMAEKVKAVCDE